MESVFIVAYLIVSAIHLFFCIKTGAGRWQRITKVLLMPLLLGAVLFLENASFPVALALLFGWIGDILLLSPGKKRFFLGGLASFLIGHACYIPVLIRRGSYSMPRSLIAALLLLCIGGAAYASLHPHLPGGMRAPVLLYLLTILGMAYTALNAMEPVLLAGAVLFLLSDYLLAWSCFIKRWKYSDFFVMLTYLSAQFCLALGLCAI